MPVPIKHKVILEDKDELVAQQLGLGKTRDEIAKILNLPIVTVGTIMCRAQVVQRAQQLLERAAARANVQADRIIEELAYIGFSNIQDYIKVDAAGLPRVAFTELTRGEAAAIAEFTTDEKMDDFGNVVRKVKFRLYDKRAALVDLGKHIGLFKEEGPKAQVAVIVNISKNEAEV